MCGIAGIIAPGTPLDPEHIAAMCDVITYRGPDDFGYLAYRSDKAAAASFKSPYDLGDQITKPDILLGHRRLSILDLSEHGRQPFSFADGRFWMVFNGEVYNYLEIRDTLQQKGYTFRTQTDTEVILAAYLEWGEACLERFNGMWAFVILDTVERTLFCARDRLGIKPFYYHFGNGYFSFSSEIKQLLQLPWVNVERNDASFFDYLGYKVYGGNTTDTYFKDIVQLQRGHYLRIRLDGALREPPVPVKWWDISLEHQNYSLSDDEAAQKYRELLIDAVRLRLRADVPIGTCLSGGLDSSGIVCITDQLIREKNPSAIQKTFTATSEDPRFDEREYAQAVIDATQVEPHFTQPTAESLLDSIDKLVWHHDEPFISTSIFAGWKVFELVRQSGVTVTLDGQGPDEMLGGYFRSMMEARMAEDLVRGRFIKFFKDLNARRSLHAVPLDRLLKLVMLEFPGMRRFKKHAGDISSAERLLNSDFFETGLKLSTYLQTEQDNLEAIAG
ncbi:MAG: asparagine synthase (glutamine-hydrolyzing), partial [Calditrichota bacterium]